MLSSSFWLVRHIFFHDEMLKRHATPAGPKASRALLKALASGSDRVGLHAPQLLRHALMHITSIGQMVAGEGVNRRL